MKEAELYNKVTDKFTDLRDFLWVFTPLNAALRHIKLLGDNSGNPEYRIQIPSELEGLYRMIQMMEETLTAKVDEFEPLFVEYEKSQQNETVESLLQEIDVYAKSYGINHMFELTQKLRELLKA